MHKPLKHKLLRQMLKFLTLLVLLQFNQFILHLLILCSQFLLVLLQLLVLHNLWWLSFPLVIWQTCTIRVFVLLILLVSHSLLSIICLQAIRGACHSQLMHRKCSSLLVSNKHRFISLVSLFLRLLWSMLDLSFMLLSKRKNRFTTPIVCLVMIGWETWKKSMMRCRKSWRVSVVKKCSVIMWMISAWFETWWYLLSLKCQPLSSTQEILALKCTWSRKSGRWQLTRRMNLCLSTVSSIVWMASHIHGTWIWRASLLLRNWSMLLYSSTETLIWYLTAKSCSLWLKVICSNPSASRWNGSVLFVLRDSEPFLLREHVWLCLTKVYRYGRFGCSHWRMGS